MKNNFLSRLKLRVPIYIIAFLFQYCVPTPNPRGGKYILNCTHQYWVKIDAVHVQPLDFIQEIQLGNCRHLTPAKWLSLSNHKNKIKNKIENKKSNAIGERVRRGRGNVYYMARSTYVSSLCISPIRFSSSAF